MSYVSLTHSYIDKMDFYINRQWAFHENNAPSFFTNVALRVGRLYMMPVYLITTTIDTAIGIIAGVGAILTLGLHDKTLDFAFNHLKSGGELLSRVFENFVKVLNPQAPFFMDDFIRKMAAFRQKEETLLRTDRTESQESLDESEDAFAKEGIITTFVIQKIVDKAGTYVESSNPFVKHICSRFTFSLGISFISVTKAADLAIGLIAATFALLTLGRYENLNNLAFKSLQVMNVVEFVITFAILILNPFHYDIKSDEPTSHSHNTIEGLENNNGRSSISDIRTDDTNSDSDLDIEPKEATS